MVRLALTDPGFDFDKEELERQIATFCKNAVPEIRTEAQWLARVAALTAGEQTAAVKAILRAIRVAPPLE